MSQLFFKKPLQVAIRERRKTSTIRRWDRPRVRAGGKAYAPGVGWLEIDVVEQVELDRLTDEDARADGFNTRAELLDVLRECYPNVEGDGKEWFRVRFRLREVAAVAAESENPADGTSPPPSLFPPPRE